MEESGRGWIKDWYRKRIWTNNVWSRSLKETKEMVTSCVTEFWIRISKGKGNEKEPTWKRRRISWMLTGRGGNSRWELTYFRLKDALLKRNKVWERSQIYEMNCGGVVLNNLRVVLHLLHHESEGGSSNSKFLELLFISITMEVKEGGDNNSF